MKNALSAEVIWQLKRFQHGVLDLPSFQAWVSQHANDLVSQVPAGTLSKLQQGDQQLAMKATAVLLPACADCQSLCPEGRFSSRREQGICAARVASSVQKGCLKRISRPRWFHANGTTFGADGYLECTVCNAI
jgi:hypothetical protein